jgi:hypothetical protein
MSTPNLPPLLDELTQAAEERPPMPVSAMPVPLPLQWEMGRVTNEAGEVFVALTLHQPNQKIHLVMPNADARRFAEMILEQTTGLTIAHGVPA